MLKLLEKTCDEKMVSLNFDNYKINIFQTKFKTSFERNEYTAGASTNLWFKVIPSSSQQRSSSKHQGPKSSTQQDGLQNDVKTTTIHMNHMLENDETDDNDVNVDLLNEYLLSILQKFIQNNTVKIEKLIDMNLELCVQATSGNSVLRILYTWETLFLNIELNLFFSSQYFDDVLKAKQVAKSNDEKISVKNLYYISLFLFKELINRS